MIANGCPVDVVSSNQKQKSKSHKQAGTRVIQLWGEGPVHPIFQVQSKARDGLSSSRALYTENICCCRWSRQIHPKLSLMANGICIVHFPAE